MTDNENVEVRFQLYRMKLIRPHQAKLSADNASAAELFRGAVESRPERVTWRGTTWRVGNVLSLPDENALYFAIGRTTPSTSERFDEEAKDFLVEQIESSPYTYCVVLIDLGVMAIAHKPRLAASTQAVANQIRHLVESTDFIIRNGINVTVDPLPDPKGFIEAIETAYAVVGFTATFRGPNPIDADEIFQKPLAVIASATSADIGQVKLHSADLNRDAVTSIARSTAATGNQATAKIREEKGKRARTLKMGKAPAELIYSEAKISPAQVAADLRTRYKEVRSNEGNQNHIA